MCNLIQAQRFSGKLKPPFRADLWKQYPMDVIEGRASIIDRLWNRTKLWLPIRKLALDYPEEKKVCFNDVNLNENICDYAIDIIPTDHEVNVAMDIYTYMQRPIVIYTSEEWIREPDSKTRGYQLDRGLVFYHTRIVDQAYDVPPVNPFTGEAKWEDHLGFSENSDDMMGMELREFDRRYAGQVDTWKFRIEYAADIQSRGTQFVTAPQRRRRQFNYNQDENPYFSLSPLGRVMRAMIYGSKMAREEISRAIDGLEWNAIKPNKDFMKIHRIIESFYGKEIGLPRTAKNIIQTFWGNKRPLLRYEYDDLRKVHGIIWNDTINAKAITMAMETTWIIGKDWKRVMNDLVNHPNPLERIGEISHNAASIVVEDIYKKDPIYPVEEGKDVENLIIYGIARARPKPHRLLEPLLKMTHMITPDRRKYAEPGVKDQDPDILFNPQTIREVIMFETLGQRFNFSEFVQSQVSNKSVLESTRQMGGRNLISYRVLKIWGTRTHPITAKPCAEQDDLMIQYQALAQTLENDTVNLIYIAYEIMLNTMKRRNPRLYCFDVPTIGGKHRIPQLPEWHCIILANYLGDIGFKVVEKLCPKTFRDQEAFIAPGRIKFSGDLKLATDNFAWPILRECWHSILWKFRTDFKFLENIDCHKIVDYLIGPYDFISWKSRKEILDFNPLKMKVVPGDLINGMNYSFLNKLCLNSGLDKILKYDEDGNTQAFLTWRKLKGFKEFENNDPQKPLYDTYKIVEDHRIEYTKYNINDYIEWLCKDVEIEATTTRGIQMSLAISFPSLVMIGFTTHMITGIDKDHMVLTGDDNSSSMRNLAEVKEHRNNYRRMGAVLSDKEFISYTAFVHAERFYKEKKFSRQLEKLIYFRVKTMYPDSDKESNHWVTMPQNVWSYIDNRFSEDIKRRIATCIFHKYSRKYKFLLLNGLDIFNNAPKPLFPMRLFPPPKTNHLGNAYEEGKFHQINNLFLPSDLPITRISDEEIKRILDRPEDRNYIQPLFPIVGESPYRSIYERKYKEIKGRMYSLTQPNPYRNVIKVGTPPALTEVEVVKRFLEIKGEKHQVWSEETKLKIIDPDMLVQTSFFSEVTGKIPIPEELKMTDQDLFQRPNLVFVITKSEMGETEFIWCMNKIYEETDIKTLVIQTDEQFNQLRCWKYKDMNVMISKGGIATGHRFLNWYRNIHPTAHIILYLGINLNKKNWEIQLNNPARQYKRDEFSVQEVIRIKRGGSGIRTRESDRYTTDTPIWTMNTYEIRTLYNEFSQGECENMRFLTNLHRIRTRTYIDDKHFLDIKEEFEEPDEGALLIQEAHLEENYLDRNKIKHSKMRRKFYKVKRDKTKHRLVITNSGRFGVEIPYDYPPLEFNSDGSIKWGHPIQFRDRDLWSLLVKMNTQAVQYESKYKSKFYTSANVGFVRGKIKLLKPLPIYELAEKERFKDPEVTEQDKKNENIPVETILQQSVILLLPQRRVERDQRNEFPSREVLGERKVDTSTRVIPEVKELNQMSEELSYKKNIIELNLHWKKTFDSNKNLTIPKCQN